MTTETLAEVAIEQNIKQFLLVLSVSLSIATLPQFFSWFRQIPYTLLLVIVGLGLAFVDVRLVNLSPQLILTIFLPPLLFEAAWNMEWAKLKQDLVPITLFAIVGVIISVIGVGLALNQTAEVTIGIALLLGACVAATDPVSVIALFRELGVDKRLTILMEGESLFNDGIAVVAFSFVVGFALGTDNLEIQELIARFFTVVGIGIGCGCVVGFGISYLTQRFDLPLVEQSLTLVSAYGTYIITEDLGGSGVIGVVTTGLVLGNFGSRIGMQPSTRLAVTQFWDFLAFFVNSIVFLLIGDQIKFEDLGANLGLIAITIAAMIVTRAISIYGLSWLSNLLVKSDISLSDGTILWWGGLRGSVAIALALSVPVTLPQRTQIIAVVFGVVLFTLLVQGLTTKPLVTKLTPLGDQAVRQEYLEAVARWVAMNRVLEHLTHANLRPEIDPEFYRYQKALVEGQLDDVQQDMNKLRNEHPQLREFAVEQLQEELLAIEADTYAELVRGGRLNDKLPPMLEEVFKQISQNT
jgi:CPA1 family monovalent cation:H+ antiporter